MKLLFPLLMSMLPAAMVAQSPPSQQPPKPKTTEVLVIQTVKEGVALPQVMAILPAEIRATVKLYLEGKIRQWYSRGDGRGVIFFVDAKSVEEAHAIMETLPLAKEHLMDHEYIPVGPLLPLGLLANGAPAKP